MNFKKWYNASAVTPDSPGIYAVTGTYRLNDTSEFASFDGKDWFVNIGLVDEMFCRILPSKWRKLTRKELSLFK